MCRTRHYILRARQPDRSPDRSHMFRSRYHALGMSHMTHATPCLRRMFKSRYQALCISHVTCRLRRSVTQSLDVLGHARRVTFFDALDVSHRHTTHRLWVSCQTHRLLHSFFDPRHVERSSPRDPRPISLRAGTPSTTTPHAKRVTFFDVRHHSYTRPISRFIIYSVFGNRYRYQALDGSPALTGIL